jgi:predicted amidophosphoribosyltransferase
VALQACLAPALTGLLASLFEALGPERCAICGVPRAGGEWAAGVAGPAPGLRAWETTHCCAGCLDAWHEPPRAGLGGELPLWAARLETAQLVGLIGAWKYRGLRGLARPLAALLVPVVHTAVAADGPATLVPLPLHPRRRRERGFDQTLQLTVLGGRAAAVPVAADILVRRRATGQQASRPAAGDARLHNVAGAFVARGPAVGESPRVALVDDLVTTGATLGAAAAALQAAGWQVVHGLALGIAARLQLDGPCGSD